MLGNYRIYVEKKPRFNVESKLLLTDLKQYLSIPSLSGVRIVNIYDIFNITAENFEASKYVVFAERNTDDIYETFEPARYRFFAYTAIPGQFDQRADSALECLRLLNAKNSETSNLSVSTGTLIILEGDLTDDEIDRIKKYMINPNEAVEKDLSVLVEPTNENKLHEMIIYQEFNDLPVAGLTEFLSSHGLAMSLNDIRMVQNYFKHDEKRAPTETEIKVLDTYWSDHCRHTTFETVIDDVTIEPGPYQTLFRSALNRYSAMRAELYGDNAPQKPMTLMDTATIYAKLLRKRGELNDVEQTEEINACSVCVEIDVEGTKELWSLQFKNETHNHPTEIEPYGGASTCLGGAIRDPLSGRSYVYQAVRISGSGDPRQAIDKTFPGKLPQRVITTKAAHGFSAYGNQIGLATTYVNEIYHPGYMAKRMEVGMVVGAAPYKNICRERPVVSDAIILLGGCTGRDGCGGATGSSKIHTEKSTVTSSAEVQKGDPITERKIQRLFRNPDVARLIKKCNDFGAGGVSVAIGELARGLHIYLEKIPVKYVGLTPTELAISESQERMAVVVAEENVEAFIHHAEQENLQATVVAKVTGDDRLVMTYHGREAVSLSRVFLDSNGAKNHTHVTISGAIQFNEEESVQVGSFGEKWRNNLTDLNVASQRGLCEMFDSTIGSTTVLMPFGGKYKISPCRVSVQKFPVINGSTDHASIVSFGFDPYLSSRSPFHGALFAVVDSVAKIVAAGADHTKIKFSFQEYYEKLGNIPEKWGKPFAALLGALYAQEEFGLPAIGGKDSMSGSFKEMHVPPTLISFAVAPTLASRIISPEFKEPDHYVYLIHAKTNHDQIPDFTRLVSLYNDARRKIEEGNIVAAMSVGTGGIAATLSKMSFGNHIGICLEQHREDLFAPCYGSIVVESKNEIHAEGYEYLGKTTSSSTITFGFTNEVLEIEKLIEIWEKPLATIFKFRHGMEQGESEEYHAKVAKMFAIPVNIPLRAQRKKTVAQPRVVIPVFPGTNCEYDSARAFKDAGAIPEIVLFNNLTAKHSEDSLLRLSEEIRKCQILMLPGGFSAGDEPNGSAKFISAVLRTPEIRESIHLLLENGGLILGICNGFQALIKSGLLPYGKITDLQENSPTLTFNTIGRHISAIVGTKVINNSSPWLRSCPLNQCYQLPISHGEGRVVMDEGMAVSLYQNGQIVSLYVDINNNPRMDCRYNPNGSSYAIEGMTAYNGQILGKMAHSERYGKNLYKNIPEAGIQDIFSNGVNYFK